MSASRVGSPHCDLRALILLGSERDRVELRNQAVEDLEEKEIYSLGWLAPFIPINVMPVSLTNVHRALQPGGWLVVATLDSMLARVLPGPPPLAPARRPEIALAAWWRN